MVETHQYFLWFQNHITTKLEKCLLQWLWLFLLCIACKLHKDLFRDRKAISPSSIGLRCSAEMRSDIVMAHIFIANHSIFCSYKGWQVKQFLTKISWYSEWYPCIAPADYNDVIMGAMASQITSVSSVNSTVCSGIDQIKHQSTASLAFVWGIHRWPVNSPHKGPVTRKVFPFDDAIMIGFLCGSDERFLTVRFQIQYKGAILQVKGTAFQPSNFRNGISSSWPLFTKR